MLPAPATRAVIYSAAKTAPAPAHAGPPVLAALKITASCGQRPCRAWHESLLAAGCPGPAPPPTAQCSRQSLLHPSRQPLTPLGWSVRRARGDHSASLHFGRGFATPARASLGILDWGGWLVSWSSDVFCALCSPLPASAQSLALTRPLLPQGARAWCPPKIPPTRRPAERASDG